MRYTDFRLARRLFVPAAFASAVVGTYAALVEPRWLEVTHTRIHFPDLPDALAGLRIALLTDFHHGNGTRLSLIRRACASAMAERPDLIALTGDLADDNAGTFRPVLDILGALHAPLGVYAVPGNHDHKVGIARWQRELASYPNIIDLCNRALTRDAGGTRLCIAGIDDYDRGFPSLGMLPPAKQRDFTILLAHNPDQAEHLWQARGTVDLVLSGHTHGGQVRLPWIGPLSNPSRHDHIYVAGLYPRPWTQVYVSRGIGTQRLPIRLLCRPEVAILELTR